MDRPTERPPDRPPDWLPDSLTDWPPERPYSYLIFLCREFWDDLSESPGNHSHCNYEHSLDEFWVDFFQLPGNRIPCICFWCLYAENLNQFSDYFYEWHSNYIHCILFHVQKNPLQNLLALDSLYLSHFLTEWAEILRAYSLSGKFRFRHKTVILQHCSIACTPTESPSPKQPISQPFLNRFDWNFEWLLSRWKGLSLESTVWIQLQPF